MSVLIGFRINEVFGLYFDDELMALYMNLSNVDGENRTFAFVISDDGETIGVSVLEGTETKPSLEMAFPDVTTIPVTTGDDLYRMVGQEVQEVTFGVGELLVTKQPALYYVFLKTTHEKFLFFNNGDEGAFSLDSISGILNCDIYDVEWRRELSGVTQGRIGICDDRR
jgi:hypothetical protein